jgi:hypothetical protein
VTTTEEVTKYQRQKKSPISNKTYEVREKLQTYSKSPFYHRSSSEYFEEKTHYTLQTDVNLQRGRMVRARERT